jgi:hypothetical protein
VLPCGPPFSLSLPSVAVVPDKSRRESHVISNLELLECLGNQTTFYGLYTKLTNRAIDAYVKAGRRKFAVKLHGSLAALDVLVTIVVLLTHLTDLTRSHRGRLTSGLQTYSSLPAHYAPHNWTSLESYMLSQAINVYALAGTNRDKQWVNIVLKYLKLWSSGSIGESLTRQDDSATYIANLVESLKLAVDKLSERL